MEHYLGPTGNLIKVIMTIILRMDMEFSHRQMGEVTQEIGVLGNNMEREHIQIRMVSQGKVNGTRENVFAGLKKIL